MEIKISNKILTDLLKNNCLCCYKTVSRPIGKEVHVLILLKLPFAQKSVLNKAMNYNMHWHNVVMARKQSWVLHMRVI